MRGRARNHAIHMVKRYGPDVRARVFGEVKEKEIGSDC